MPRTTGYSFADVILVPFPFTDQSGLKKRPALVISSDAYHSERADLLIMAITSLIRLRSGFGASMISDWRTAGLLAPSLVNPSSRQSTSASC